MIGLCARWWPIRILAPEASAIFTSRSPSSIVGAIGFSSSIGSPASMHFNACSTCSWFGVARITPSGRSLSKSCCSDSNSGTPAFAATDSAAGAGSTSADSVHVGLFWATAM